MILTVLFNGTFVTKKVTSNDAKIYPLSNNCGGMSRILAAASKESFKTNSLWVSGVNSWVRNESTL